MIGSWFRLRLVLRGVSPLIVRTIEVPAVVTLAVLNEAMLVCFGWLGEHLHEFTIRAVGYSTDWAVDADDSETVTLYSLELRAGERFCWAYDFFANWNVDIRVEAATVANRGSDLWMSGPPHHGLGIVMLKPVPPPGGRWNHGGREGRSTRRHPNLPRFVTVSCSNSSASARRPDLRSQARTSVVLVMVPQAATRSYIAGRPGAPLTFNGQYLVNWRPAECRYGRPRGASCAGTADSRPPHSAGCRGCPRWRQFRAASEAARDGRGG